MARDAVRRRRILPLALLLLGLGGCDYWYSEVPSPDDLWHRIPWFDHMLGSPAIDPYETAAVPRNTIEGTVPVSGGEPSWEAEWTSGNFAVADQVTNPVAGGEWPERPVAGVAVTGRGSAPTPYEPGPAVAVIPATVEARGDTLYQTFCAVCHGTTGAGDGPVGPRVAAPSLLTPRAVGYSDGYLYSVIRYGRGVMPRYGDKIYAPLDRWAVVNHVRRLQGVAAPAPGDTVAAAPRDTATAASGGAR